MLDRISWLKKNRSKTCPKCNGEVVFRRSLVKSTFFCDKCNNIWIYCCLGFTSKKATPIWYYENKELNKELTRVSF
jgi:hypothetical protein